MKIAATADLHGIYPLELGEQIKSEQVDLLLVAGDISTGFGENTQLKKMKRFINWAVATEAKNIVITPGNHDYWAWKEVFRYKEKPPHVHCLIDQSITIDRIKIHGSPYCPVFMSWNYMKEDHRLAIHWEQIPEDTDILMTHCPAYGVCDSVNAGPEWAKRNLGSKTLLDRIWDLDIPYHVSGHIHSAEHDWKELSNHHKTKSACVSHLNEDYDPTYPAKIWEMM